MQNVISTQFILIYRILQLPVRHIRSFNSLMSHIERNTSLPALRFNGGGHINHSIFWKNLCPEKDSGEPEGELLVIFITNYFI